MSVFVNRIMTLVLGGRQEDAGSAAFIPSSAHPAQNQPQSQVPGSGYFQVNFISY